jgi:hypothetical protein
MRGLARSIVMLFAYAMAIGLATAVFLMFLYLTNSDLLDRLDLLRSNRPLSEFFQPFVLTVVGIVAAVFTLLPVLVALVFAETCGSQSIRYFLIWGLAAWGGLWFLFGLSSWLDSSSELKSLVRDTAAFATGGLTWGFVYWIIAGRTSGDWIDQRTASA